MKNLLRYFIVWMILTLLAAACAPAATPAAVSAPADSTAPETAPTAEAAPLEPTAVTQLVPQATSRGDKLVASDPAAVQVGAGKPVLIEFFRFT